MRLSPVVVAAVVLSGCAQEGEVRVGAAVIDSAGVEIVTSDDRGTMGALTLEETLRLGVLDGEGPEQFSQLRAVAVNADRAIAVGDNGSATVRVFDASGAFVAELGGRGEGPGEVSTVNDVFAFGDTVGIIDWQRGGKVVMYTLDGALLASWSVRQLDGGRVQPIHPTPEGWLTQVDRPDRFPRLSPGEVQTLNQEIYLAEFGSADTGPLVYTIPVYTLYGTGVAGELAQDWALFRPRTYSGFDALGQLYVTDNQAYRIDVHALHGGLRRSIRLAYSPRPITTADVQDLKDAALHVIDTLSRMPDQARPQQRTQLSERIDRQATLPLPAVMTPLSDLLVSPDGSIWVNRASEDGLAQREADQMFGMFSNLPQSETSWDLFDQDGAFLGSVTLPARFRAEAVRGLEVVGVWADEFDVEYVVRYEVKSQQP